jgi:hypothetical protein
MDNQKTKQVTVTVTAEIIDAAERDSTGRCMVTNAIKASVPGVSRVESDMQTLRFTRDGERETYFTPWDVQNALVRFDGGDPIEPFSFRLVYRNRVIVQRAIVDPASKPVDAARSRALDARRRAEKVANDPDASDVKKARAAAKAVERQREADALRAEHGPVKITRNRPPSRVETDTERGVRRAVPRARPATTEQAKQYPNLARTGRRIYGARVMRANQPDAREHRGFPEVD